MLKFLLSINYLYWLGLSAVLTATGELMSKEFAIHKKPSYIVYLLIAYTLGTLAWIPAIFEKNSLEVAGTLWAVLTLVATILIGALVFGEKVSPLGIAGLVAALVAVVLLSIS
jgi:multidrug transporter EmrE-like cation transporter